MVHNGPFYQTGFTGQINDDHTRRAYVNSVRRFHVAAWIEDSPRPNPPVKQKLAAVRMLFNFLVVRQIVSSNPAHAVRGPQYVVKKGKTPL